jgi:hypothetical protein
LRQHNCLKIWETLLKVMKVGLAKDAQEAEEAEEAEGDMDSSI